MSQITANNMLYSFTQASTKAVILADKLTRKQAKKKKKKYFTVLHVWLKESWGTDPGPRTF